MYNIYIYIIVKDSPYLELSRDNTEKLVRDKESSRNANK